jgi:ABC-2 type transport system permease protein
MRFSWVAFYTLAHKEMVRFFRIWIQTILPSPITMMLYMLIFGDWLGRHVGDFQGFSYIQYICPGLILMSVITNSYSNVVSSFFGSKFVKSIEELYVAPMGSLEILLGFLVGGVMRGLVVAALVTMIALGFTSLKVELPLLAFIVVLLTAILFSTAGLINGVFSKKFDDISIVPTFVLSPLTYLGGVFYSVSLLPPFWAAISKVNPIFYMVDIFRYSILGVSEVSWQISLLILSAVTVVAFVFAWYLLERGVGVRQ